MTKQYYVEIVQFETDEVVKRMGPHSEHNADRIDDGANINIDHERYYTRIVSDEVSND